MDTFLVKLGVFATFIGLIVLWAMAVAAWKESARWYHWPREFAKLLGVMLMGLGVLIAGVAGLVALVSLFTAPVATLPAGVVFFLVVWAMSAAQR